MKLKGTILSAVIVTSVLWGCEDTNRDVLDPRLSAYTESGANSAGTYINGNAWRRICINDVNYCEGTAIRYDTLKNQTRISFGGTLFENDGNEIPTEIYFDIFNVIISGYDELSNFSGTSIPINGNNIIAGLIFNGMDTLNCGSGDIVWDGLFNIRNVGSLFYSNGNSFTTFSGTFGFIANSACWRYEVLQGRFDYRLDDFDFQPANL